ncbi:MAG: hypothetical protein KAV00_18650, partial [Phycisphaerae bacterium]|nr:hypothetical protein [Phycisphaerae bacterium]
MNLKSIGKTFLWLTGAAIGFGLFVLVSGRIVGPDIPAKPPSYDAREVAAAEEARKTILDRENPPRLQIDVDYSKGKSAPWYPKGESPVLAELVKEGKLPPVAERVGPEPCVMLGIDGKVGKHGGTWLRVSTAPGEIYHMTYRMAYANLVRFSPQGYPIVPHLAKSFSVSKDNKEFTFTLRKGVRWSDGHPFTADDIMYWWN